MTTKLGDKIRTFCRSLYEAGDWTSRKIERADEIERLIAEKEAEIKALRGNLASILRGAKRTAAEFGWSAEQIAAAERGEMKPWTEAQIAAFRAERAAE